MNSGSVEILAREEGLALLLLLSTEGDSTDRSGGAASSSTIDDALKSSRSNTSILRYNISNPYIQVERRS